MEFGFRCPNQCVRFVELLRHRLHFGAPRGGRKFREYSGFVQYKQMSNIYSLKVHALIYVGGGRVEAPHELPHSASFAKRVSHFTATVSPVYLKSELNTRASPGPLLLHLGLPLLHLGRCHLGHAFHHFLQVLGALGHGKWHQQSREQHQKAGRRCYQAGAVSWKTRHACQHWSRSRA